jgi:pimeloyl-ACP methyl ester carboxylesterase
VSALSGRVRCVVPDLPLGSHGVPMDETADLSPRGLAGLIAELLDRLELDDVTLVGNDTGGALCQLVAAHHPERIGRLVLTNCDAFENFPPATFRLAMRALGRVPGAVSALELFGRSSAIRRRSMALVKLTLEPVPDSMLKAWIAPLRDRRVRRDLIHVLRGISPEHTLDAADRLRGFESPALIVWGMKDPFFPFSDAQRLVEVLPNARLEQIENARAFVQLDAPERLGDLIAEFASTPAQVSAGS